MAAVGAAVGAVVLAGGRSSRMGTAKACLEWHGSTLLRRVVGVVGRAVEGPVVVVRSPGQPLPVLPPGVEVVDDAEVDRGPLEGMAAGFDALGGDVAAAFVCATDLPFLHPAFVRRVLASGDGADVVLPVVGGYRQPLLALYRACLAPRVRELLEQDRRRVSYLLEDAQVNLLDEQALLADPHLQRADPHLDSVLGVNDPPAYEQARTRPAPEVVVQRFGAATGGGTTTVRAATLGGAAQAVGLVLDRHLLAAIDGDQVVRDVETPLVQGDVITFLSADAGG